MSPGRRSECAVIVRERFNGALRQVETLLEAQAEEEARRLLGEAIDLLRDSQARRVLSPISAVRAVACMGRWGTELDDGQWNERRLILRHASF